MNKKGQDLLLAFIGIIGVVVLIVIILLVTQFFLNSGMSTDYVYSIEKNKFWNKVWLKDDHTTVYCFDDPSFISILEDAKSEGKKVTIYYEEYLFRGFLCSSGNEKIGTVVVTDVKVSG